MIKEIFVQEKCFMVDVSIVIFSHSYSNSSSRRYSPPPRPQALISQKTHNLAKQIFTQNIHWITHFPSLSHPPPPSPPPISRCSRGTGREDALSGRNSCLYGIFCVLFVVVVLIRWVAKRVPSRRALSINPRNIKTETFFALINLLQSEKFDENHYNLNIST